MKYHVLNDYRKVYRYGDGIRGMGRDLLALLRLSMKDAIRTDHESEHGMTKLTFSVLPGLTERWIHFHRGIDKDVNIVIGNCSGEKDPFADDRIMVYNILNIHHGEKIDLFLKKIIASPIVILSDDDVYIRSKQVYAVVEDLFSKNGNLAAVSLLPRKEKAEFIKRDVDILMGSHCLALRRDIVLESGVSFAMRSANENKKADWFYDTGDYLQLRLQRAGFEIDCKTFLHSEDIVALDGMSTWLLEMRATRGDIGPRIRVHAEKRAGKAYRTALAAKYLNGVRGEGVMRDEIIPEPFIERAIEVSREFLDEEHAEKIERERGRIVARLTGGDGDSAVRIP
ncbi:MAG: hypothetical protein QHI48_03865 [Bacteroidota bacterium]|nr:hypothetical protein [Bacteroidota bacterium]